MQRQTNAKYDEYKNLSLRVHLEMTSMLREALIDWAGDLKGLQLIMDAFQSLSVSLSEEGTPCLWGGWWCKPELR
jgi:hypothetical protein